nr:hypothetical protein [Burkholderia stagnalis]
MNEGFLGILRLAAVAIQNLGFAVVVGALFGSRWLARGDAAWQAAAGRRMVVALRVAAAGALLASVVAFLAHCALMSDATLLTVWPAVWPMLTGTGFGHAWFAGALGMGAIVVLSFRWRGHGDREPAALWSRSRCGSRSPPSRWRAATAAIRWRQGGSACRCGSTGCICSRSARGSASCS